MKKALFFALLFLAGSLSASAQLYANYVVSNATEFLQAIGSQRTIVVNPGEYDFSAVSHMEGDNYTFLEAFDGMELQINGVSNLTIQGSEKEESHLITQPRYGHVIRFKGCQGITITNIKAGHGPERGYCTGGVLLFEGCQGITIEDCHLYGSGTEGLTFIRSQGAAVKNTIIKSCTYSILSCTQSQGIVFNKCKFFDNQEFELVNVRESSGIVFKGCEFNRNRTDYNFFAVTDSEGTVVKKCRFSGNSAGHLAESENEMVLKGVKFNSNEWKNGKFKN